MFSSSWRALLSSASDNCLGGGVGAKGKTSKSRSLSNYENNIKHKDKTHPIFRIATGFETQHELMIKYQNNNFVLRRDDGHILRKALEFEVRHKRKPG